MSESGFARPITRREALERAAWLLGGVISAPTLAGVLAGCGVETGAEGASLEALTERQRELVATIAEHIIPETDTPGARAVRVDAFIDRMLARYYPARERELFLAGLGRVDERARAAHGAEFLECAPAQQRELLLELDRESFASPAARPRPAQAEPDVRAQTDASGSPLPEEVEADSVRWIHGELMGGGSEAAPFFRTMKELTVVGYYTSEAGATEELRHEAVPGRFDGCIPFAQVGRTWAV